MLGKLLSVEAWTGGVGSFKVAVKVGHVFETGGKGDFRHRTVGFDEFSCGVSDAGLDEVGLKSDAQLLAEEAAERLGVQGGHAGDFIECNSAV